MIQALVQTAIRPTTRMIGRSILLTMLLGICGSAQSAPQRLSNADLAVILPAQRDVRIAAQDVVAPLKEPLLPRDLLSQVENAFKNTSVGDALQTENSYVEWTLVSARIVPCSPLGVIPSVDIHVLCWPEVRLVWQPLLKDFRRYAVILKTFADDRAIHTLYDFSPALALNSAETTRAEALLSQIKQALNSHPTAPLNELSDKDISEFIKLRDKASDALMQRALTLRVGELNESQYSDFNERPEFNNSDNSVKFVNRMKNFVAQVAPRKALKEMTSFSLPEGREPPQADEWVFLQFLKQKNAMEQNRIHLRSAVDGRVLFDFGLAPKASQMRDEPDLHTALDSMNQSDAQEIKKRVLLSPSELGTKKSIISDRNVTLVPNTSCASCHKLNNLRFDFHALSYLEDRTISVSSRVKTDVARDLEWLKKRAERP